MRTLQAACKKYNMQILTLLTFISIVSITTVVWMKLTSRDVEDQAHDQANLSENIPLDKACDIEKTALPIDAPCPTDNVLTDIEAYTVTKSIDSTPHGYANVRHDANFTEEYNDNILTTLSNRQEFCTYSNEPVKPINPETGLKDPLAYQVLLRDSNDQYCKGYVSSNLVSGVKE